MISTHTNLGSKVKIVLNETQCFLWLSPQLEPSSLQSLLTLEIPGALGVGVAPGFQENSALPIREPVRHSFPCPPYHPGRQRTAWRPGARAATHAGGLLWAQVCGHPCLKGSQQWLQKDSTSLPYPDLTQKPHPCTCSPFCCDHSMT